LRLSATPNGKDHPDIRMQNSDIRSQNRRPAFSESFAFACRGGGTAFRRGKLSSQKTLRDPRTALRPRGLPLRSHNSLLYDCPSTNAPASPTGDAAGMFGFFSPRLHNGTWCRRLSRFAPKWIWRKPLPARRA